MIRPITFVSMLLAAGSGLYLYQAKQQARVLDRQIARHPRRGRRRCASAPRCCAPNTRC